MACALINRCSNYFSSFNSCAVGTVACGVGYALSSTPCALVGAAFFAKGAYNWWTQETPPYQRLDLVAITKIVKQRLPEFLEEEKLGKGDLNVIAGNIDTETCQSLGNLLITEFSLKNVKEVISGHLEQDQQLDHLSKNLPSIRQRLFKGYDEVFKNSRKSLLNENTINHFLTLYHQFLNQRTSQHPWDLHFMHYLKNEAWPLPQGNNPYSGWYAEFYKDIDVELSFPEIEEILKEHGVLQLRPINKAAKTLLLACGNGRLSDGGNSPNCQGFPLPKDASFPPPFFSSAERTKLSRAYSVKHNHPRSVVTIDPCGAVNPTICAFFGEQSVVSVFRGQKFDEIIFEGYWAEGRHPYEKSDVKALLKSGGRVYLDEGLKMRDITNKFLP